MSVKGKGFVKKGIRNMHHSLSHFNRIEVLSDEISLLINNTFSDKKMKAIDVGCGDMRLAEAVDGKLESDVDWMCIDVFTPSIDEGDEARWEKFVKYDGQNMPFDDGTFDFATICLATTCS